MLRRVLLAPEALLPLCWAFFWLPVISGQDMVYMRDLTQFAVPMKAYMLERLSSGELPLWTPYVSGGMPFLADPANQVFYPPNLIFFVFSSVGQALAWFVILHNLFGMFSFAWLCRTLSVSRSVAVWAGLAYGLTGYVLSITDNVNLLPAVTWAPAALASFCAGQTSKTYASSALASICLSMMVLAGDPLNAVVVASVFAVLTIKAIVTSAGSRQSWPRVALSFPTRHLLVTLGLAGLITAAQVLPAMELAGVSVRQSGLAYDEMAKWSFPFARLLELVQPFFFASNYPTLDFLGGHLYPTMLEPWVNSVYLGAVVAWLAVIGIFTTWRVNIVWLSLLTIALLMSFGGNAPYHQFVSENIPFLATQRYPEKLVFWLTLSVTLFAAFGAMFLLEHRGGVATSLARYSPVLKIALSVLAVALITWLFVYLPGRAWVWEQAAAVLPIWSVRMSTAPGHLQILAVHTILVAILFIGLAWISPEWRGRYIAMLLVLGVMDLAWVHYRFVPTMPDALYTPDTDPHVLKQLDKSIARGEYRIYFDIASPGKHINYTEGDMKDNILKELRPGDDPILSGYAHLYARSYRHDRLQMNSGTPYRVQYLNGRFSPLQPSSHRMFEDHLLINNAAKLMALSNVRYVITSLEPHNPAWDGAGFQSIHSNTALNLRIMESDRPLPRALLVHHAIISADSMPAKLANVEALKDSTTAVVITEKHFPESRMEEDSDEASISPVVVTRPSPEHFDISGDSPYDHAFLLVNESYYRAWKASIEGVLMDVVEANVRFMAIPVMKGRFDIELRFEPTYLVPGLFISGIGLLVCGFLLIAAMVRRNSA
jgi:hypothetical protein